MRLSVSQIAWESGRDPEFADVLRSEGFGGVDIAPTKVWPDWATADPDPAGFKNILASGGLQAIGMQSIFFGTKNLNVLGDGPAWIKARAHFQAVCTIAAGLGVSAIVFGAPANRDPGGDQVGLAELATSRFSALGDIAAAANTCLCMEPVPAALGCRFLRTTAETVDFIRRLRHQAVKVNIDSAVLLAENASPTDIGQLIDRNIDVVGHVHASEPELGSFEEPRASHAAIARELRAVSYGGAIAIEMRAANDRRQSRANLVAAMRFVSKTYG